MNDELLLESEVEQKIIDLVQFARQRYQIRDGCGGQDACRKAGLQVRLADLGAETDGSLSYEQRIVLLNRRVSWHPRIEFTLFHELTHYLLEDDGEIIEYFTRALRTSDEGYRRAIERCCHVGAAEFLLPRDSVRTLIHQQGFSVDLIEQLARQHGASLIASAIQLAICAPVECYVVICDFGTPRGSWPTGEILYVDYSPASRAAAHYPLARYSPIPKDHLFYRVWEERLPAAGQTYVPFRSGRFLSCYGEAKFVGGRVFGVLALQRPPVKEQLPLFVL